MLDLHKIGDNLVSEKGIELQLLQVCLPVGVFAGLAPQLV